MLDPWFVTGFSEGGAAFTYSRGYGTVITPYFAIKLSATDLPVLQQIQVFFGGVGALYEVKARRAPGRATKTAFYFRVSKTRELGSIVAHFDRYPLIGAKATSYWIWREMVMLKQHRFRKRPSADLELLARRLSDTIPRNRP